MLLTPEGFRKSLRRKNSTPGVEFFFLDRGDDLLRYSHDDISATVPPTREIGIYLITAETSLGFSPLDKTMSNRYNLLGGIDKPVSEEAKRALAPTQTERA